MSYPLNDEENRRTLTRKTRKRQNSVTELQSKTRLLLHKRCEHHVDVVGFQSQVLANTHKFVLDPAMVRKLFATAGDFTKLHFMIAKNTGSGHELFPFVRKLRANFFNFTQKVG